MVYDLPDSPAVPPVTVTGSAKGNVGKEGPLGMHELPRGSLRHQGPPRLFVKVLMMHFSASSASLVAAATAAPTCCHGSIWAGHWKSRPTQPPGASRRRRGGEGPGSRGVPHGRVLRRQQQRGQRQRGRTHQRQGRLAQVGTPRPPVSLDTQHMRELCAHQQQVSPLRVWSPM